jgi:hypothetical protein
MKNQSNLELVRKRVDRFKIGCHGSFSSIIGVFKLKTPDKVKLMRNKN